MEESEPSTPTRNVLSLTIGSLPSVDVDLAHPLIRMVGGLSSPKRHTEISSIGLSELIAFSTILARAGLAQRLLALAANGNDCLTRNMPSTRPLSP
jgi:hypothetical protein